MSFYSDVLKKDPRFGSLTPVKDMALLEPGFRAKVEALIADAAVSGVHFVVLETYRSQARQHLLWQQKVTELSKVGCHGYGVAVDLGLVTPKGTVDPVGEHYEMLRQLCTKHKIIWGGDWGLAAEPHSFRDWDHVQAVPLFRQDAMFAGQWYPPDNYDPWADMLAHGVH